jgi:hypothetical protein
MPTLTGPVHATSKLRRALGIGGVGLSTLVAAGVAALFLALPGSSGTSSAPRQQPSGHAPLIQHRGEGLDGTRDVPDPTNIPEGTTRQ